MLQRYRRLGHSKKRETNIPWDRTQLMALKREAEGTLGTRETGCRSDHIGLPDWNRIIANLKADAAFLGVDHEKMCVPACNLDLTHTTHQHESRITTPTKRQSPPPPR